MRKLNKKQIEFLDYLYAFYGCVNIEDMPKGAFEKLEKMNDFETLFQCAETYLIEKDLERVYKIKDRSIL